MEDKRREHRYPARIAARVLRRECVISLLTNDVSFHGAFVRSVDATFAQRQLLRVGFSLPGGELVSAHAMVAHIRNDGSQMPGIGLQFWGPLEDARAWERYVYELKIRAKAGKLTAASTDGVRRASERFKLALEVMLDGHRLMARDVSSSGLAIRTESPMPIGMRSALTLQMTGRSPLTFDVVVRRRIEEPGFSGLGVELVDVAPDTRSLLRDLLREHAEDADAIYIDPDDPGLH